MDPHRQHVRFDTKEDHVQFPLRLAQAPVHRTGPTTYPLFASWAGRRADGSGLPLWFPNTSGIDRLKYAWRTGPASGTSLLKNGTTGNDCMDVFHSWKKPNAPVIVHPCLRVWTRTPDGPSTGQITVYSGSQKMCLDTLNHGTANGTPVVVNACTSTETATTPSQQWLFYTDGTIRQPQSGRCLDRDLSSDMVQLWTCWGGTNQKWRTA